MDGTQKRLEFINQNISYSVRLSRRARRMRLAVYRDASVVVTLPVGAKKAAAEKFVRQKFSWIVKILNHFSRFRNRKVVKVPPWDFKKNRLAAFSLAKSKVEQWNEFYKFPYGRINIKNQKTRWGSCSRKGNLNFNYKIVHLPENLLDYLVAHELCHLKELNHSKNFWLLVARAIPNYKVLRKELRNFGFAGSYM